MNSPPAEAPYSALHVAAQSGNLDTCKEISMIARELLTLKINGKTPEMLASEAGKTDVAEFLARTANPPQRSMTEILRSPERLARVGG